MKGSCLWLNVVFLLFSLSLRAQPVAPHWFVLVHHNAVKIGDRIKLGFGDAVADDAPITLGGDSYLSLFSETGEVTEIAREGVYTINDLKPVKKSPEGFSGKELIKKSQYAFIDPPFKGTVCAGVPMADFLVGGGSFIESDTIRIEWKHMLQDSLFTFFILDDAHDEMIYSIQTTANFIVLSPIVKSKIKEKAEGNFFYVDLQSHAYHGSSELMLKWVSTPKEAEWRQQIYKTYPNTSAANCLLHAMILVDRGFPFAAEHYFKQAIALRRNVPEYKKVWDNYRDAFKRDCH